MQPEDNQDITWNKMVVQEFDWLTDNKEILTDIGKLMALMGFENTSWGVKSNDKSIAVATDDGRECGAYAA